MLNSDLAADLVRLEHARRVRLARLSAARRLRTALDGEVRQLPRRPRAGAERRDPDAEAA